MSCWESIICCCKLKRSTIDRDANDTDATNSTNSTNVMNKETNKNSSKEYSVFSPTHSPSIQFVEQNITLTRRKSALQPSTSFSSLGRLDSKELHEAVLNGVDALLKRKKSNLLTYQDVDYHHTTSETSTEYVFKNAMSFEDIMTKANLSERPTESSSTISGYIEK